jgi:large subunit ribosomal protein L3
MSVGILGTKLGMTQMFDSEGNAVPITVIQAGPCTVTQVKMQQTDGYTAVQLGYGEPKTVNKYLSNGELGHLLKSGAAPLRHLCEYRVSNVGDFQLGQQIKVDIFSDGQEIDVVGTSIGKGFAGYQKRHNFKRGPMAHGSKNHRSPGSTGAGTTPGRVYPGKRMAGRLGGTRCTVKKLILVQVDTENNLLLVKGAVPGKPGALLSIIPAKIVGKAE